MRYGFDTQAWGASRHDDLIHWSRFPAFRQLQTDLIEPRLTLPNNTGRNAIFMRWKERFLVTEHHVQDIIGASFAGMYMWISLLLHIFFNLRVPQVSIMSVLNSSSPSRAHRSPKPLHTTQASVHVSNPASHQALIPQ